MRLTALAAALVTFETLFPPSNASEVDVTGEDIEDDHSKITLVVGSTVYWLWCDPKGDILKATHNGKVVVWNNRKVLTEHYFPDAEEASTYKRTARLNVCCGSDGEGPLRTTYYARAGQLTCHAITVGQRGYRIDDPNLLRALRLVEGERFATCGNTPDNPYSVAHAQAAWRAAQSAHHTTNAVATINGTGGWDRYFVTQDGEVHFSASHGCDSTRALAKSIGFSFWR